MTWRQMLGWVLVVVILFAPLLAGWMRRRADRQLDRIERLLRRIAEDLGIQP